MLFKNLSRCLAIITAISMAIPYLLPSVSYAQISEDYRLQIDLSADGHTLNSPEELYSMKSCPVEANIGVFRTAGNDVLSAVLYCGVYQGEKLLYACKEEIDFKDGETEKRAHLLLDISDAESEDLAVKFYLWKSENNLPLTETKEIFKDTIRFFVSQKNGNDNNCGDISAPVKTLAKAKELSRTVKDKPTDIILREGDYFEHVCFNEDDSRESDCPLTIRPFCKEKVRLIGAKALNGKEFTAVTNADMLQKIPQYAQSHVRQISLPSQGITDYGEITPVNYGESSPVSLELFINRSAMTLARWPNDDYARIESICEQTDTSFTFTVLNGSEQAKRWSGAEDVWMYGFWYWDWMNESFRMKSVNPDTGAVTAARNTQVRAGQRFYIYNLLEELDHPGEFYLDRKDGTLYVYPNDEIMQDDDILLSLNTEPLLEFSYTSNIYVKGLEIGYTRGKGIVTNRAKNVSIEDCTLLCTGQIGIYAEESSGFIVSGCDITETGAGGILCSGGDFSTLASSGNLLTNNHIWRYSRLVKSYTPAFRIAGVGTVVSHNLIHDAEHNAIMYSGNNHVMEYNEIYNVCTSTDDSGAIYTGLSWSDRGNIIRCNYLHDITGPSGGYGVSGVYLDDMHSSTEIYGNIFYRVSKPILIGGGRDNIVENNLILEATENSAASVVIDQRGTEDWFSQNISLLTSYLNTVPYRSDIWRVNYPELYSIMENNPRQPRGNKVKNNLIYRHKEMGISPLAEQYGNFENNFITAQDDIGFVDYANKNFAIKKDSEVYEKIPGFIEIPIEKIGLLR